MKEFLIGLHLCILALFISLASFAQISGCNDPNANNYNASATINDGSCTYNQTNCVPQELINPLSNELVENSGLIFFNNRFWTHNDSGGEACIFELDSSNGQIIRKIYVRNANNNDWEDIANDSLFVYVGDFGNNSGTRQDLHILKIQKADILAQDTVDAEFIRFSYADQLSFAFSRQNHNFDCEAMIIHNDSIFLFTKNWVDNKTKIYTLPTDSGEYVLSPLDSFNVNGLITGADISPDKSRIVLSGYHSYRPFFWIFWDYQQSDILSGNKRRIDFPIDFMGYQTEGICFVNNNYFCISNEKSPSPLFYAPRIFIFDHNYWTSPNTSGQWIPAQDKSFRIIPNPCKNRFTILTESMTESRYTLFNTYGAEILSGYTNQSGKTELCSSNLSQGIYYLSLNRNGKTESEKIIILP